MSSTQNSPIIPTMADGERNNQTEAGDPFSVFAELENSVLEGKRGLHLFSSKLNELLFEATMTKNGKNGISKTEKQLIREIAEIYTNNMERAQRARDLINAAREAHDRQS